MTIDLFARLRPDADLHPQFLKTRDDPWMAPARAMLREVAATMTDPDGNLVEQFQTHGFDARTFEIYLHALFTAEGHTIDRQYERPDFLISRDGVTAAVEAVTANPTPTKNIRPYGLVPQSLPRTRDELMRFLKHELAIRIGSPLYSKLQKKYWELPHVAGLPLIFAIQSFHDGALHFSSTSVTQFLFGVDHSYRFDEEGNLIVEGNPIAEHQGSKTIPSNFFSLPGAENLSAVLFSNAGTVPKFGRLGQQGAHFSPDVRMVRYGTSFDHDPNASEPDHFAYEVGDPDWPTEPWRDGTVLIHNPNALRPVPAEWLGTSSEENLVDGQSIMTWRDPFLPFESLTKHFPGDACDAAIEADINAEMELRAMGQALAEDWRSGER